MQRTVGRRAAVRTTAAGPAPSRWMAPEERRPPTGRPSPACRRAARQPGTVRSDAPAGPARTAAAAPTPAAARPDRDQRELTARARRPSRAPRARTAAPERSMVPGRASWAPLRQAGRPAGPRPGRRPASCPNRRVPRRASPRRGAAGAGAAGPSPCRSTASLGGAEPVHGLRAPPGTRTPPGPGTVVTVGGRPGRRPETATRPRWVSTAGSSTGRCPCSRTRRRRPPRRAPASRAPRRPGPGRRSTPSRWRSCPRPGPRP